MKIKKILSKLSFTSLTVLIFILSAIFDISAQSPEIIVNHPQSVYIEKIISGEKNLSRKNDLIELVNFIDTTYGNLYERLENKDKITIFFDPAHGLLSSGKWQGDVTWRQSAAGLPEEFYSLALSRKLYGKLKQNQFINISSSEDYINALENNSEFYKNIPFSSTIKSAKSANSFMIISSHLNNIAPVWKADGKINLPGMQITCDKYGNQLLTEVKTTYQGYLTLYNKLDSSGFSYDVAINFKDNMLKNKMIPNNWDYGAVAYDRFSFFYDFPISIIFESGFISNPKEEEMLRSEISQEMIADSQYKSILNSVKTRFGIDISGSSVKKTPEYNQNTVEVLKLSQISLYFIRKTDIQSALNTCAELETTFKKNSNLKIDSYIEMKNDLISIRNNINAARNYRKQKSTKTARNYYYRAITVAKKSPVYYNLKYMAIKEYNELTSKKIKSSSIEDSGESYIGHPPAFIPMNLAKEKHSSATPYIFIYDSNDSLKSAIERSITDNPEKVTKLVENFKNAQTVKYKYQKYYSKKDKKYKWKQTKTVTKVAFSKGIFIVKLDKNMKVIGAEKVSQVAFNPKKYQNKLFFKNSYLAVNEKNRLL